MKKSSGGRRRQKAHQRPSQNAPPGPGNIAQQRPYKTARPAPSAAARQSPPPAAQRRLLPDPQRRPPNNPPRRPRNDRPAQKATQPRPPNSTSGNPLDTARRRPLKTLDRVLSKAGLGSRTDARKWIGEGRVKVNGKLIQSPDHWVDFARDKVTLDDQPLHSGPPLYLLLYKPTGYLTTFKDPEGRPTIYDLIQDAGRWVVPVGRLDLDTSGLLLLTSDTQFAERVANPDYKVPKTYLVKSSTLLGEEQLQQLRDGVTLNDGPTKPAGVKRIRDSAKYSFIEITIHEGRNRQVRRMIEAVGSRVLKLVRVAIGPLRIGDLPIGTYRELTPAEIALLAGGAKIQRSAVR